jgi:hypothetical protein
MNCHIKHCPDFGDPLRYHFCEKHFALIPFYLRDEIWKAYVNKNQEPEVYAAFLEGAQRRIMEIENDDGC